MKSGNTARLRAFLPIVAAVALVVVAMGAGCADRFILPPVPRDVMHDGSQRRAFRCGNSDVEFFVARSPGATTRPAAYVLRFTGDAAGAAKFTACRWQQRPVEVWVANYPGYGESTGPRTLRELARVSLAAFDQLKQVAGDRPIIVDGFSLGTTPALCIAARRPVAGVMLQPAATKTAYPRRSRLVEPLAALDTGGAQRAEGVGQHCQRQTMHCAGGVPGCPG